MDKEEMERRYSAIDGKFFDRQGNAISLKQWGELMETDPDYKIVKQEEYKGYYVSTVWLGIDHNFARFTDPTLPPHIFETMIFKDNWWTLDYQERYSTEAEALAGHEAAKRAIDNGEIEELQI